MRVCVSEEEREREGENETRRCCAGDRLQVIRIRGVLRSACTGNG